MSYSNLFCILFLSLICGVFAQNNNEDNTDLGACGICEMAVNTLEGYVGKSINEADLLKDLSTISTTFCNNVPSEILTKEKCTSFVTLYAPYIVELLFSTTKSDLICNDLGLCDTESPKYQILFPTIENGTVSYSTFEENYKSGSQFYYKIFLGNPQFLDNETYTLTGTVSNITGTDVNLKITNRKTSVINDNCRDKTECEIDVTKPGKKVWYYITVNVKVTSENPFFTLNITEQNVISGYWEYKGKHGTNIAFIFIMFACILGVCSICLSVTSCLFRNRSVPDKTTMDLEEMLIERRSSAFIEPINNAPMLMFLSPNNVPIAYPIEQYYPYTITQE